MNALRINHERFETVVAEAIAKTSEQPRWQNAILRAAEMLDRTPYVHVADGHMLVLSDTSSEIYDVNGACQCAAFKFGKPCKHRALKRLLENYAEVA